MPATLTKPGFDQQSFDAFLARAQRAGLAASSSAARPGSRFANCLAQPQRRRVDADRHPAVQAGPVRLCRADAAAGEAARACQSLLTARRRSRRPARRPSTAGRSLRSSRAKWAEQGVLFGSLDELVHTHGDLLRTHLFTRAVDPTYDKFAALHAACWSGGHAALRAARRRRSTSRCIASRRIAAGGVDLGHTLVVLEEGAEATLLSETASHDARRRRLALRRDRADRRPRRPAAARQPAELGARRLALRPSEGARRPRRVAAMDDRRPRQPAGQGESARRAGRPRRRVPGQRRDVHRGQAAPLVPHAPAPRRPRLPQRLALQVGPAGPVAHRLARHDQGRSAGRQDQRLPAERQPDALGRPPGPIRFPAWRSRPTTSAARTAPRPAGSTKSRSSTPSPAA